MKSPTPVFVVLAVILSVAATASARTGPTIQLGRSWLGRPIRAAEEGNPAGTRVLVVGSIHGNETAGIAVARALERVSPSDLDLWIGIGGGQPIGLPEQPDPGPRE